jgi:hypothetical protein
MSSTPTEDMNLFLHNSDLDFEMDDNDPQTEVYNRQKVPKKLQSAIYT